MNREKKYAVFVLFISLSYTALPYVFTAVSGTERNAEKSVIILLLGLIAELFYVFYLDIALIVIPLAYALIKTKVNNNKLNVNALLLRLVFFSAIYFGNIVSFTRFSDDIISNYKTHSYNTKWHITKGNDVSIANFAVYTYNMPVTYFGKMDEHARDGVFYYLPGLATRVLMSIILAVTLAGFFIYCFIKRDNTPPQDAVSSQCEVTKQ